MIAVAELNSLVVDLEPLGDFFAPFFYDAGKGRFGGRIVEEDGELVSSEMGLDLVGEEIVELDVPSPEVRIGGKEGDEVIFGVVDMDVFCKGLAVAQGADGEGAEKEEEELRGLQDHLFEGEKEAVPLGHSKFGIVKAADFPFSEDVAEEVDVLGAGREEPLHRIFGRGVEVALFGVRD